MSLAESTYVLNRPPRGWVGWLNADRLALLYVLMLHVGAVVSFFPPAEAFRSDPLYEGDYPVHTHRVHVYRESLTESVLPWGYDPGISGGAVMDPVHDVGAKSLQVLGVVLPFVSAGMVVRLFLLLALLGFPIAVLMACRRLELPEGSQVWTMVALVGGAWLVRKILNDVDDGLITFVAASYFSVFVLAEFHRFAERPSITKYIGVGIASSLLFLLHLLGPVVIAPSLVLIILASRNLTWRWRLAAMAIPLLVVAVNAFWFIPFIVSYLGGHTVELSASMPPDMITHKLISGTEDLVARLASTKVLAIITVGVVMGSLGYRSLRKQLGGLAAAAIGLAAALALFLTFFGSFIPVVVQTQPVRFLIPAFAFLTVLVGAAAADVARMFRLPVAGSAAAVATLLALAAVATGRPKPLNLPPASDPLVEFVASRTAPFDRLLVQSEDGYRLGGYHTKVLPLKLDREVIGCNFPIIWDPPQFLNSMLFGRPIQDWAPDELRTALTRWGVAWVFSVTPEAQHLLSNALETSGEEVGVYRAFQVPDPPNRIVVGRGRVDAEINRIELTDLEPEDGLVVLRYRYHPGWRSSSGITVSRYPVPEDPAGFIALDHPSEAETLHFRPASMLRSGHTDDVVPTHAAVRVETRLPQSRLVDVEPALPSTN